MLTVRAVCLVSCVGLKRAAPAAARDLYVSPWFLKARTYAERISDAWFILSAEHGLLAPGEVVAPYERTLNLMAAPERLAWAERVRRQMDERLPDCGCVVVLAGMRYREHLMPYLELRAATVDVPMRGLGIGEQLGWLKRQSAA